MKATGFRNKPIDRRRLNMYDRSQYNPSDRLGALMKAKQFRANELFNQKRKPFTTEQKPGSGGFQAGRDAQAQRNFDQGAKQERAEALRPEESISKDIYKELFN